MTIQELADRAAVTTRTIRYYVEQGVLPPPGRGRPSEYTGEHLRLLDLVRRLKEQYLPLEEIRDILQRLTPDEVEEFLGRTAPPEPQPGEQVSAADYISQVLHRGSLRSQLKEQAPPPSSPRPIPPPAQPEALPYQPAPAPPIRRSAAVVPQEPSYGSSHEVPAAAGSASHQQASPGEERTWQRVTLAPGVELHYEAGEHGAPRHSIRRLIEAARTILGSNPEKGTEE
ncbi:MAG TPA: MerR family transcriptional regulator, partial [Chloroflexia bacterium]|nr:MerR family transcriptional regulator [Chloroflexia bacterium]